MVDSSSSPLRDPARLSALNRLISSGITDRSFDRLTRLATRLLDVPAAWIGLVDAERQILHSQTGLPPQWAERGELPLSLGCCPSVVRSGEVLRIRDVRASEYAEDPDALEDAGVIAYLGIPAATPDGHVLGAFSVMDTSPREWKDEEVELLADLTACLMKEVDLHITRAEAERTRVDAEAARRHHEALLEGVNAIMWEMDARAQRFTYVSRQAEEVLGYPVEQWLAEPNFRTARLLHPDDRDWIAPMCREAGAEGRDHTFEYRAITADGRVLWLHDRVRVSRDAGGNPTVLHGMTVDVTQRTRAELALRESEERFRMVVENLGEGVLITDLNDIVLYANPRATEIFGYTPAELIGRNASDLLLAPEEKPRIRDRLRRRAQGVAEHYEARHIRGDGTTVWVDICGSPYREASGRVIGTLGVITDITERKSTEEALRHAKERYEALLDSIPDAVWLKDEEGRYLSANAAVSRLLGVPLDQCIGRTDRDIALPEFADGFTAEDREVIQSGRTLIREQKLVLPDGREAWFEVVKAPFRNSSGKVVGTAGIAREVTDRKQAEAELSAAEAHYRRLVETSPYGIYALSADGFCTEANSALAEILGRPAEELVGMHISKVFAPEDLPRAIELIRSRMAGEIGTTENELRMLRPSGEVRTVRVRATSISEAGVPVGVHGVVRDVTEEKGKEQALRRVERLASLGTLIGGVAHELNNPLHAIRSFAQLMLMDRRNEEDQEALEIIQREADRAAKVVSDLRLLTRQTQEDVRTRELVDLNEVVGHVLRVRRYSLQTSSVEVREDLADTPLHVLANRGEMEQVVLNLIVNAEQAMAGQSDAKRLTVRTHSTEGRVVLRVTDTGPGIAPDHVDRIFDPFWTTKAPGEGTGLGLPLVHSIVVEHGGQVRVESERHRGAVFQVDLPQAAEDAEESVTPQPDAATTPRSLRVLVVDDEPAVRRALVRYLERRGHHTAAAADGAEALCRLEEEEYDVILSDLRMPGLGGDRLLRRLQERGQGLERRVVFLTGDAASPTAARFLADAGVPVLLKPVNLDDVARVVESHSAREHDDAE